MASCCHHGKEGELDEFEGKEGPHPCEGGAREEPGQGQQVPGGDGDEPEARRKGHKGDGHCTP